MTEFKTRSTPGACTPRRPICKLFAVASLLLWYTPASAAPIATWTFETSPPAAVLNAANYPNPISADIGIGTAGGHHGDSSTDWQAATGNGSATSFEANFWNTFDYFQFAVPTTGFKDIVVSWDITRSSTSAPSTFELQYSTTGVSGAYSVGLDDFLVPVFATWSTLSADLSALVALNNNSDVVFRLVAVNAGSTAAAAVRVDNFSVTGVAVPEPTSLALLLLGSVWALFTRVRRERA